MQQPEHSHHHDHHHSHLPKDASSGRIAWAFFLNVGFTIIEFIGGWLTNSTAIMADAVHDLGDSLSIGMAWLLNKLSARGADESFTYGFKRFSLLGALLNGLVLILGSIWVLSEAVPRLFAPQMPAAEGMALLAVFGVAVNGYAAYKLSAGKSLNERVLNWHLIEDVFGWVAVLVVAITLMFVDWPILDPILSICFTLFICVNVLRNLKETFLLFLQGTPDKNMRSRIIADLEALPEVDNIHHLHLWSLDGQHHVLTVHLVLDRALTPAQQAATKTELARLLAPYELAHSTIEFEFPDEACRDTTPVPTHG